MATPGNYTPIPYNAKYVTNEIFSAQHHNKLVLQADGNLVVYDLTQNPIRPLWASGTNGAGADVVLFLQSDGNLVLKHSTNQAVIWQSGIFSTCSSSQGIAYYILQDDGNLIMKSNEYDAGSNLINTFVLGSTGTDQQRRSNHFNVIN